MGHVVLSDFDGTIADIDTAVFVLENFADPVWRLYDEEYERGKTTLEECLQKQFATVKASRQKILNRLESAVHMRRGFKELVHHCSQVEIPFVIVSAGLDFVIDHLLRKWNLNGSLTRHCPKTTFTDDGIKLTFPRLLDPSSVNFKDDFVKFYAKKGDKATYIGDGFSDFSAATLADHAFAIKGSRLAEMLTKDGVPHEEIQDFRAVTERLKTFSFEQSHELRTTDY